MSRKCPIKHVALTAMIKNKDNESFFFKKEWYASLEPLWLTYAFLLKTGQIKFKYKKKNNTLNINP